MDKKLIHKNFISGRDCMNTIMFHRGFLQWAFFHSGHGGPLYGRWQGTEARSTEDGRARRLSDGWWFLWLDGGFL
jgi:hypothetical protein